MSLSNSLKTIEDGYHGLHIVTDEELKRLQKNLVEMLSFVKEVCEKNDIEWGLCGGNALGAIRHKGFIPWDDDIDICMTRSNYNKLACVFPSLKQERYELICPGEKDNYWHFPRIYDTRTKCTTLQVAGRGTGVPADIIIIEDMYDNIILDFMHGIKCTYYLFVISCLATHKRKEKYIEYGSEELIKKTKLRDAFSILFRFRSIEKWIAKADAFFGKIDNPNSLNVCCPSGAKHFFGEIYKREDMCRFTLMPFENCEFPVYRGVHNIMRQRYGDSYMELPPESKREKHAFIELDLGD